MNIIAKYESSAQFLYSMNQLHAIGRPYIFNKKKTEYLGLTHRYLKLLFYTNFIKIWQFP